MYELIKRDGMAKRGRLTTVHGTIETPVFMNEYQRMICDRSRRR